MLDVIQVGPCVCMVSATVTADHPDSCRGLRVYYTHAEPGLHVPSNWEIVPINQ